MQNSGVNRNPSLKVAIPQTQQSLRRLGFCSKIATGGTQQSSPVVFPEKRSKKVKTSSRRSEITTDPQVKPKADEHRIDIGGGDEKSDLLGSLVYAGKIVLDKRKPAGGKDASETHQSSATDISNKKAVDAKLTRRALVWGSDMLQLDDVVSVTYNVGLRHFTVHAYPIGKGSCGLSCFKKPKRSRKDFRFVAPTIEEAVQWVASFGDQQCFINCLPHPLVSKKKGSSELFSVPIDTPPELVFRCKSAPKMLVILNPRSGHGRSSKVFHDVVEPIFKLAGIKLEVVKTTKAGHARELASTVDINLYSDGIICVGGDGIINEVLNGLLSRSNQKEGVSIPIGIVPAGSDNSLVWTVLGVRDPISAALAIVKGGLTATDVFAVEWVHTGVIHFGMTVSYYGFVSDVLELSEKYQKRFGPMRYLVAGFLKFMCLPNYSYEVEYLPAQKQDAEDKSGLEKEIVDVQDLYTDVMRRSSREGMPRASSLSSIDSIMTPSVGELDTCGSTHAATEPSEYVRGIDPKMKRMSSGRRDVTAEAEVIHPQGQSTTPNWPRTRSKSRTDKGWMGLTSVQDPPTRCSWGNTGAHDREDISSTVSDPGPIWDAGPKWDTEPSAWDVENSIELPGPPEVIETGPRRQTMTPRLEEKWVAMKEQFLGIMVCNHFCRTVQSSQVVAHNSEDDDGTMDMLLFHGCGRLRLMRFLQTSRHLSLPYVECVKVKSSSPVKPLPPFGELLITGYGPFMVNLRRTLLLFVTNICGTHRKFNKVPFVRVSNRYCSIHSPPRCFLLWLYRLLRIQHLASTFPPLTMPWYARRCYLRGCFPGTEARRSFIIECSRWFRLACQFDCLLGSETRRSRNRPPLLYSSWMKRLIQSIVAVVAAQAPLLICSLLRVEESLKLDFKMIKTDVFSSEIAWIFFNLSFIAYVYVLFMELRASEIWMTRFVTR